MFGRESFRDCVAENFKAKNYGEKRFKAVMERYDYHSKVNEAQGMSVSIAGTKAMNTVMEEIKYEMRETVKAAMKEAEVTAAIRDRILQGMNIRTSVLIGDGKMGNGVGTGFGRAAMSFLTADSRLKGQNLPSLERAYLGKWGTLMEHVLDRFSRGAFGVQRGAAHGPNVIRELFGKSTGDASAKEIADAVKSITDTIVDDFNKAGGSLRRLNDYIMPQKQNAAKVTKQGFKQWADDHMQWLDWGRMRWPNGDEILPDERMGLLSNVYATLQSDGAVKINPNAAGGRGAAVGNMMEHHRFMVFKDSDSWLGMHEKYGDGSVFDVFSSYMQVMARRTALVQMFGRNPSQAAARIRAEVRLQAGNAGQLADRIGGKKRDKMAVADADAIMKNRFDPVFEVVTHQNPMDPNSFMANTVTTASNILAPAQLGGLIFAAMGGDFVQTLATRFVNHMPLTDGIATYLKNMALPGSYGKMERIMARAGFIADETISGNYNMSRFIGPFAAGPAWSRRVGDVAMRATLINRHTNIARWTTAQSFMGALDEFRARDFGDLPFKFVLERYGITERDWNVVRALPPSQRQGGTTWLAPTDILNSSLIDKDQLFRKFFVMIDTETRNMVPASSAEATVMLRGSSRPDTLPGAILHSFSMYKNFPLTFAQTYGRLALSRDIDKLHRIGFIAGLGLSGIGVGAMATQMKEVAKGRTPLPMDTWAFWGKAIAAGGGMSIWGDFLFGGVNQFGGGPAETAAGPIAGLLSDTTNLVFGDGFAWARAWDQNEEWSAKLPPRAIEFIKRNTPGTSLWYARLVLEREIWDRLQGWLDPKARQKWRRKVRKQEREFGNTYYWPPGETLSGDRL